MGYNHNYLRAENWSGTYGIGYWGGSTASGGNNPSDPNRMPNNSGFNWGGADSTISATIALNTALQLSGIQVEGFEYEWRVKNYNTTSRTQTQVDPFEITVDVKKADGSIFTSYNYQYGRTGWQVFSGSESFGVPHLPVSFFGDVVISAQAQDIENYAGHYGPEFNVSSSSFKMTYSLDPCYSNPLHSATCPGYATAFYNQQCTANPLYDSGCTGYAAAYLTQQCTSNPLYSTSCTGYTTAYYNQQCALDALYDKGCKGYQAAYTTQQCSLDPSYDPSCTGYATAIGNQQCIADPTSDPSCPDYYVEMCKADALYDQGCSGYSTAYFDQQCSLDGQYDQSCPGYIDLSGNDGDVAVLDPVVDDVVNVQVPVFVVPEPVVVVEDTAVEEETVVEVEIVEVVIDDTPQEIVSDRADLIEEEVVMIESVKKIDKVEAKAKKIKEIRQEIIESLADKMSTAASFGIQTEIQSRIIKVLNFVQDFDGYGNNVIPDGQFEEEVNLKGGRNVDHQFARWFVNDPNYERLEAMQYELKGY